MTSGNDHDQDSPVEDRRESLGLEPVSTAVEERLGDELLLDAAPDTGDAVAISILQRVVPGREQDFEEFLHGLSEAANHFPGFIDVRVFRPVRSSARYRIVLRFESERDLQRWVNSEERKIWITRAAELAEEPPLVSNISGTAQARPIRLALTPLEDYVRSSISGIGLLLLATMVALVLANSPLSDSYENFWTTELTIGTEDYAITETLRHWVNDGLMALFFFILGLEIKREILVGELRYPRQAALPIAAAVGGATMPALCYFLLNMTGEGADGWGVPIGTDTAFALGILSIFAGRVRTPLLVFLTASTIVDDILAVLVIAVFYTSELDLMALAAAGTLASALAFANIAGFHRWPVYAFLGFGVWLAVFESGVHGTIAGVVVAMLVPARSWINPSEFIVRSRQLLNEFESACYATPSMLSNEAQHQVTQALEALTEQVETPLSHFEHQLSPMVTFGVLPIFAFANAGIPLVDGLGDALSSTVTWGVILGLVIGKPVGITLFSWLAVRSRIARMPSSFTLRQIFGIAWLGGIGFTMSIFIAELAFGASAMNNEARIGVLAGSLVAGGIGYLVLRTSLPPRDDAMAARI